MSEYDTDLTNNPVCPYCGHEDQDYTDYDSDGVYECERCNKPFRCVNDVTIQFTTSKTEPCTSRLDCGECEPLGEPCKGPWKNIEHGTICNIARTILKD